MLITRKFAIEIAKYSFNRSAWSQRQSIRMIIWFQDFRINSWCSASLTSHRSGSIVFHLWRMFHTSISGLSEFILPVGGCCFLCKSCLIQWLEIFILSLKLTHSVIVPFWSHYIVGSLSCEFNVFSDMASTSLTHACILYVSNLFSSKRESLRRKSTRVWLWSSYIIFLQ